MKTEYIWCSPDLLWGIRSHPQRGGHGARDHAQWRHTSDLSVVEYGLKPAIGQTQGRPFEGFRSASRRERVSDV